MRGDANLRLARVTKGNRVVAGLADDAVIRFQPQLLVQKFQVDPVAVFFADGPRDKDGLILQVAQLLRQEGPIDAADIDNIIYYNREKSLLKQQKAEIIAKYGRFD